MIPCITLKDKIKYESRIHHRGSVRLKGYDYSGAGEYLITICCHENRCRFGMVEKDEMVVNVIGKIAYEEWLKLPERFPNVEMDVFQIMPNHMHGIIIVNEIPATVPGGLNAVGAGLAPAPGCAGSELDTCERTNPGDAGKMAGASPAPTVGNIIGAYKSLVSHACLKIFKSNNQDMGKLWQRDYYEHIIRNEQSYKAIADYIVNNPAKWSDDKFFVQ